MASANSRWGRSRLTAGATVSVEKAGEKIGGAIGLEWLLRVDGVCDCDIGACKDLRVLRLGVFGLRSGLRSRVSRSRLVEFDLDLRGLVVCRCRLVLEGVFDLGDALWLASCGCRRRFDGVLGLLPLGGVFLDLLLLDLRQLDLLRLERDSCCRLLPGGLDLDDLRFSSGLRELEDFEDFGDLH
jgi:hypothetical protein